MDSAAHAAASSAARRDSEPDFSTSVSKKLKTSTRTGQACDRCKVRKIRCDSSLGSCQPCILAHQVCRTTDRISGKATSRGHIDTLEQENRLLRDVAKQYRQVLQKYGIPQDEIEVIAQQPNGFSSTPQSQPKLQASANRSSSDSTDVITVVPLLTKRTAPSNHPSLKLFNGTKLDLFGMQIDGSEFDDEFEDTESAKSYQGLMAAQQRAWKDPTRLHTASRIPETKARAMDWATWYFRTIHPYAPTLHKPDMFRLLHQLYPEGILDIELFLALSAPDQVMIHAMFAMIKQQVGHRNGRKDTVDDAVHHFVTAMTFFPQLLRAQTIKHVQALAALALFARGYQKPEAAWFIIHPAVWATVEHGLNRSASTLSEEQQRKLSSHDIEMRKRIFWVIFTIATGISGRLGRPLPLRIQDVDVEFPEPVSDALPEEANLSDIEKCSFVVSIVGIKVIALMAQLYSNCFAVRRNSQTYEADLAQLEREHQVWQKNVPPELSNPANTPASLRIPAIYCRLWDLEFQFFLHHPVLNNQTHYNSANLVKSLDICEQFLPLIDELRLSKCIDSQWVFASLIVAVIFTILFVYDVQGVEVTEEKLQKLQNDMHMWQVILAEIDELQGMGCKIQQASNKIISRSLNAHEHRLRGRSTIHKPPEALAPSSQKPSSNYMTRANPPLLDNPKTLNKPLTTAHPYLPKVPSTPLDHHNYEPSRSSQPQQSYYAEPATPSSAPVTYHTNPPSYNNPSYTPDPSTTPYVPAATSSYYPLSATEVPAQPSSLMDQWLRWSQANMTVYPHATPGTQALGNDYLSPASSLVELSAQQASQMPAVTSASDGAPQRVLWPMNFLSLDQNSQNLGGGKLGPLE